MEILQPKGSVPHTRKSGDGKICLGICGEHAAEGSGGLAARSGKMCPKWFLAGAGSPPAAERCAQIGSLLVPARRPQRKDVPKMVPCWCGLAARSGMMCPNWFLAGARSGMMSGCWEAASPQRQRSNRFVHIRPLRAASPPRQGTMLGTSSCFGRPSRMGKQRFCDIRPWASDFGHIRPLWAAARIGKEPFWAHQAAAGGQPTPAKKHFAHIRPLRSAGKEPVWAHQTAAFWAHQATACCQPPPVRNHFGHIRRVRASGNKDSACPRPKVSPMSIPESWELTRAFFLGDSFA